MDMDVRTNLPCSGSQNCLLHSAQTHPGLNETQGRFRSRTSHWDVGGSGITAGTDRSSLSSSHMTCHRIIQIQHSRKFQIFCLFVWRKVYSRQLVSFLKSSFSRFGSARAGRVEEEDAWGQGHRELQWNWVTFPPTHKITRVPRTNRENIIIMTWKHSRIMCQVLIYSQN